MKPTNKPMKRLSLYLFLILFTLPTPSQADDIRDLQIEGMSIGDSLLDYFTKNELNNAHEIHNYKNNAFRYYFLSYSKAKDYEYLQITVKPEDKNFLIHGIQGHIFYEKNIQDCYQKMDEVKKEIDEVLTYNGKKDKGKHPADKTGKSKYERINYSLSNGSGEIVCYDMSKKLEKKGKHDRLAVTLSGKEFKNWLTNSAYK